MSGRNIEDFFSEPEAFDALTDGDVSIDGVFRPVSGQPGSETAVVNPLRAKPKPLRR